MARLRIRNDNRHDAPDTGSGRSNRLLESLETRDIYEQMIDHELRVGRLSPSRRKRIIRYAAGLGLSAVEAGKLVDACQAKIASEQGQPDPSPTLKMAESSPTPNQPARIDAIWKIGAVVLLAVVVDLMMLGLLRP